MDTVCVWRSEVTGVEQLSVRQRARRSDVTGYRRNTMVRRPERQTDR